MNFFKIKKRKDLITFKNIENDISTIVPKVTIQSSFQDFINGIDPVYEWIKAQNTVANT